LAVSRRARARSASRARAQVLRLYGEKTPDDLRRAHAIRSVEKLRVCPAPSNTGEGTLPLAIEPMITRAQARPRAACRTIPLEGVRRGPTRVDRTQPPKATAPVATV
jgi:hypothetical protein